MPDYQVNSPIRYAGRRIPAGRAVTMPEAAATPHLAAGRLTPVASKADDQPTQPEPKTPGKGKTAAKAEA